MKSKHFFSLYLIILMALTLSLSPAQTFAQGVKVIVIDPGHGGVFPGATYHNVKEKDIVLKVALRLGEIINKELPQIKVVYTRKTDIELSKSLAQDLHARTMIANNASGDLFISIHANAASNPAAYGAETILMGETTVEQQRNEAALYTANKDHLLDMSDQKTAAIVRAYIQNLQFTYGQYSEAFARLIQKNYGAQNRKVRNLRYQLIKVLYGTDMPCALTEIGFMTNPKEFAYMTSTKGQNEIARAIFGGIKEYVAMVNRTISTSTPPTVATQTTNTEAPKVGYTIQIISSTKPIKPNDAQFKKYKGKAWSQSFEGVYKYKYYIGKFTTKGEAQSELATVKKSFKDAFVTSYDIK